MSRPLKRSVTIKGHRTSLTLETEFWDVLTDLARAQQKSVSALIADIDTRRSLEDPDQSLTSAVRVFVLLSLKGAT